MQIVRDSISRDAYSAHPEHIILAMLNNESEQIRNEGWQAVLRARKRTTNNETVRNFSSFQN